MGAKVAPPVTKISIFCILLDMMQTNLTDEYFFQRKFIPKHLNSSN